MESIKETSMTIHGIFNSLKIESFKYLKFYIKHVKEIRGMTMNQIQVETKVSSNSTTYLNETKRKVFKAGILLIAVIYLYYCAIYSVYWYLIK